MLLQRSLSLKDLLPVEFVYQINRYLWQIILTDNYGKGYTDSSLNCKKTCLVGLL